MASSVTEIPWKTHISAGDEPFRLDSRDSPRFDSIRLTRMPIRLDCVSIGGEWDAQRGGEVLREIYVKSDSIG